MLKLHTAYVISSISTVKNKQTNIYEVEPQSPCGPLGGPHVRTHLRTHLRIRHMCDHKSGATTQEATYVPSGVDCSSCVECLLT